MNLLIWFLHVIYLVHAVAKETEFDFWGFIFVMLAAVMSGFRWTMTQILLQVQETVHCYSCRYIFFFWTYFAFIHLIVNTWFFSWLVSIGCLCWYQNNLKKESYGECHLKPVVLPKNSIYLLVINFIVFVNPWST